MNGALLRLSHATTASRRRSGTQPGFPLFHSCCSRPPPPSPPWMEIVRPAAAVGCSKEHQRIYADWFTLADPDGDGRITSANATKFFAMSGLSRADLKQVWAIADSRRQGFLGFGEFASAMQASSVATCLPQIVNALPV